MTIDPQAVERAGIVPTYWDALGVARSAPDGTIERLLTSLQVSRPDPAISTRAALRRGKGGCFRPAWMSEGHRLWGVAVQLYSLRSSRNWGIGDFTDLADVIERSSGVGADFVALNPVHALFAADHRRFSPYSPSSREFLNVLYIDVTAMQTYSEGALARVSSPELLAALPALRQTALVDYVGVARCKEIAFRAMFDGFEERRTAEPDHPAARGFERFLRERGEPLHRFALYQTLSCRSRFGPDWREWPEEYRDPGGSAAAAVAEREAREIRYHAFLQWEADAQLARCADLARSAGMRVGFCADLAVGTATASAEGWAEQGKIIRGFHVGAPPDAWNGHGQDWGLAAYSPAALMERDGIFHRILRAAMRHAGALRIDHVLGLNRLFLVPADGRPVDGAYLRYPFDALAAALSAESVDHGCVIVGEDLGTVPEGLRERLAAYGILSYRLLVFSTDERGRFLAPEAYPCDALAAFSTHDLPTFRGYWSARD
ncbi:MAG: 4-alpha-glucanotransferase, partial [Roseiarcus sp.]